MLCLFVCLSVCLSVFVCLSSFLSLLGNYELYVYHHRLPALMDISIWQPVFFMLCQCILLLLIYFWQIKYLIWSDVCLLVCDISQKFFGRCEVCVKKLLIRFQISVAQKKTHIQTGNKIVRIPIGLYGENSKDRISVEVSPLHGTSWRCRLSTTAANHRSCRPLTWINSTAKNYYSPGFLYATRHYRVGQKGHYIYCFYQHSKGTLMLQTNGPLYSNTVIGTLAVDGWAVTFGTAAWAGCGVRIQIPNHFSTYLTIAE